MISVYPSLDTLYNSSVIAGKKLSNKLPYRRMGRHSSVNNVITDVCEFLVAGTQYTFPPAGGIQMYLVSTSASDSAAGTGVRTVELNYLDNTYAQQTEIITLNGVTPVTTVATNILRVNDLHTHTVGSNGTAVGNISLKNIPGTIQYAQISIGYNIDLSSVYTVPLGKVFILTAWDFSAGTATGSHFTQGFLRSTSTHDGILAPGVFHVQDFSGVLNNSNDTELNVPIYVPATADIKMSAVSDAANSAVLCTAHFGGWLEDA